MPSSRWFLHVGGKTHGPFTLEQIQAVLEVERADAETPACAEGEETWLPLADALPDLFDFPLEALQPEPEPDAELQLESGPETRTAEAPPPLPAASRALPGALRPTPVTKKFHAAHAAPMPPPPPSRKALTVNEVAACCGVKPLEVLHWIRDGRLKARKVPGRGDTVVESEDLVAFCQAAGRPVPKGLQPSGRRALVVDREEDARAIAGHLRACGFETFVAQDSLLVGAVLESFRPHVVTVDPFTPGQGGSSALRFLREKSRHLGTRILVVSALPAEQHHDALRAGADAVLGKPVDPEALAGKARELAGLA